MINKRIVVAIIYFLLIVILMSLMLFVNNSNGISEGVKTLLGNVTKFFIVFGFMFLVFIVIKK